MSEFVHVPNLPRRCSCILYGEKYAERLKKTFDLLNVESFFLPDNPALDPRLAGHADLSALHAGGERLLLAPHLKGSAVERQLCGMGAHLLFPAMQQSACYPGDAQLNLCLIGRHIFYNRKTVPEEIVDLLTSSEKRICCSCNQGYTRCSACIVDTHSLITADRGVASKAASAGFSVLLISPGFIRLDGFPYGFIGGAAFKLSADRIAFTGRLDAHPDCDRILRFLEDRGIEALYLTDQPIFDIGSAIPILEQE